MVKTFFVDLWQIITDAVAGIVAKPKNSTVRGIKFQDSIVHQDALDHLSIIPKAGSDVKLAPSGAGRVNVADAYKLPITDGAANRYLRTDGAGVVTWELGGAGGTDPDAVHVNVAGEVHSMTDVAPTALDEIPIEDQSDLFNKKRCQLGDIAALGTPAAHTHVEVDITDLVHLDTSAVHKATAGEIHAMTDEAPAAGDELVFEDASDGWAKKRCQISDIGGSGGLRPATYVIAANDSIDKSMADAVCDGTADDVEIQAGLTAIAAVGGTVLLLEGTYNISATLAVGGNGITVRGMGRGTIVRLNNATNLNLFSVNGYSGFNLRDLTCDMNGANNTPTAYNLQNAVYLFDAPRFLISGCYFINARNNCIYVDHTTYPAAGFVGQITDNFFHDNYFESNMLTNSACIWVGLYGHYTLIQDNMFRYNMLCIWVQGYNCKIFNNVFVGTGSERLDGAIRTDSNAWQLQIIGNNFTHFDSPVIRIDGNSTSNIQINDNFFGANDKQVIYVVGCQMGTIVGNLIQDPGYLVDHTYDAIYLNAVSGFVITDNMIWRQASRNSYNYAINEIDSVYSHSNIIKNNLAYASYLTNPFRISATATGAKSILDEARRMRIQDVPAGSTVIVLSEALNAGVPKNCTLAGQPGDIARTLELIVTDGDASISAFSITVNGINSKGQAVSETFTFAGGLTQETSFAYISVTSIRINSVTGAGAGDVLDVHEGTGYGFTVPLYLSTDVLAVKQNGVALTGADYTLTINNADNGILTFTAALSSGDDVEIYFIEHLNRFFQTW